MIKEFLANVVVLIFMALLITWIIRYWSREIEEISRYKYICTAYIITSKEKIKVRFYTNDDADEEFIVTDNKGVVYNLSKFHYYSCKDLKAEMRSKLPIRN